MSVVSVTYKDSSKTERKREKERIHALRAIFLKINTLPVILSSCLKNSSVWPADWKVHLIRVCEIYHNKPSLIANI